MNMKRNSFIRHSGIRGSKWGYSKGSKNGKRTAKTNDEMADDVIKGKCGSGDTIKMELKGMPCALGADLSQGDDFCAFKH